MSNKNLNQFYQDVYSQQEQISIHSSNQYEMDNDNSLPKLNFKKFQLPKTQNADVRQYAFDALLKALNENNPDLGENRKLILDCNLQYLLCAERFSELADAFSKNLFVERFLIRKPISKPCSLLSFLAAIPNFNVLRRLEFYRVDFGEKGVQLLNSVLKQDVPLTHLQMHFCLSFDGREEEEHCEMAATVYEAAVHCHRLESLSIIERKPFDHHLQRFQCAILNNHGLIYAKLSFEMERYELEILTQHLQANHDRWKILHPQILDVSIAFFPLDVPCYVLLEIIDFLPRMQTFDQKKKIDLLVQVKQTCWKVIEAREKNEKN